MSQLGAYLENPKNIEFESQENGEVLYYLLRRHPITNLGWILFAFLLVIVPLAGIRAMEYYVEEPFKIVPARYQLVMLIIWYLLAMFYTFTGILTWYFNVYIITNRRIIDIDFRGLWRKRVSEALLGNVEDVTYQTHHFWQILFNYGDIFISQC